MEDDDVVDRLETIDALLTYQNEVITEIKDTLNWFKYGYWGFLLVGWIGIILFLAKKVGEFFS